MFQIMEHYIFNIMNAHPSRIIIRHPSADAFASIMDI